MSEVTPFALSCKSAGGGVWARIMRPRLLGMRRWRKRGGSREEVGLRRRGVSDERADSVVQGVKFENCGIHKETGHPGGGRGCLKRGLKNKIEEIV